MGDLIPELWSEQQIADHIEECPERVEVTDMSSATPQLICCCGEVSKHSPMGIARAEIDALTTDTSTS